MYLFSLSSRPTGPKIRVPLGSPWGLMRTAALFPQTLFQRPPPFLDEVIEDGLVTMEEVRIVPFRARRDKR